MKTIYQLTKMKIAEILAVTIVYYQSA